MLANLNQKLQSIQRRWKIRLANHSWDVYFTKFLIIPKILKAAPLPVGDESDLEIHTLVSKKDFTALLWSLYSFYTQSNYRPSLVVHDDGTLSEQHQLQLNKLFPNARFVSRQESDLAMDARLKNLPNCLAFRKKHPINLKLFDFFHFATKPYVIFFDADIIFFNSPDALLEQQENVFIEDAWTSYVLPLKEVNQRFNANLPPAINIGFGKVSADCFDTNFLESILDDPILKNAPYLFCQTTTALMVSQKQVKTMGGSYKMTIKTGIDNFTLKHYTRVIRNLFYTEGVRYFHKKYLKS